MSMISEFLLTRRSKSEILTIVEQACANPEVFDELFNVYYKSENDIQVWQSSWALMHCAAIKPVSFDTYTELLIKRMRNGVSNSTKRSVLSILEKIDIPEGIQAELYQECIDDFLSTKNPIAVRAFAMGVAYKIAKMYPELKAELLSIITDMEPSDSGGIRSRVRNITALLRK